MTETNRLTPNAIPAPTLVQSAGEFDQMMQHLQRFNLLAVDTESDSLFRYTPRVCLIQISTYASAACDPEDVVDYLLDPLTYSSIQPLGELMADPGVEVILHAAENDTVILERDFGFRTSNIYDTQLAARILGRNGVGLARMLKDEFGVHSDKKMQRTNWGRRPLTPQQMTYAQIDTHYLLSLRKRQIERLKQMGRWQEAQEAFCFLEDVRYDEPTARDVWSMKGTRAVSLDQMGLLEELWIWREETARRQELPPFKVLRDEVLVALTHEKPQSVDEMRRIKGVNQRVLSRWGDQLLRAVARGENRPQPPLPAPRPRPEQELSDEDQERFHMLRQWRSTTASQREVDPDIVFSNGQLLQIVEECPKSIDELTEMPGIGGWKATHYGSDILRILSQ